MNGADGAVFLKHYEWDDDECTENGRICDK